MCQTEQSSSGAETDGPGCLREQKAEFTTGHEEVSSGRLIFPGGGKSFPSFRGGVSLIPEGKATGTGGGKAREPDGAGVSQPEGC